MSAAGDRYVFAFQPTITVTSGNLIKFDGQDVIPLVAVNYTISGLEPGVPGAFLGDPAAAVYSGTPLVASLGSPASAPLSGSPYPIVVAPGTFTVSNGYALALDSAGKLTIAPIPTANPGAPTDPGFLPGLTQINNPGQTEYDVGATSRCSRGSPSIATSRRHCRIRTATAIRIRLFEPFRNRSRTTSSTARTRPRPPSPTRSTHTPPSCNSGRARLPPALHDIPAIVAESARRVRAARSRSEAVAILHQTVAAIHKEIALVLSEDPQTRRSRASRWRRDRRRPRPDPPVALVNSGGL